MPGNCLDEFKHSKKRTEHTNRAIFVTSQWQRNKDKPSCIYLCIRFAIFITFFVIWLLTITMQTTAGRETWAIYLTNWGFTLCLLQSCISCMLLTGAVIDNMRGKYNWKDRISRMYSVYWMLNVMATTTAFTITIIYWTLIYSAEGAYWSTMNFMVHGFNSILMFFDFWIVSHPVQLLHCFYPVLVAMVYTSMTAIYYVCGGLTQNGSPYIYPILKWDQPGTTLEYVAGVMLLMVIIHTITYFMFKLRVKISTCIITPIQKKFNDSPYYV